MTYKFKEDVSIADVAFEASGKDVSELFESCALAVTNTMVKNLKAIKAKEKKIITLKADDIEHLLHDFMNELIFIKDTKLLLFSKYKIAIKENTLTAECFGEKLDPKKHVMLVDVKAVTWHLFNVEKTKKGWKAFVVLDV